MNRCHWCGLFRRWQDLVFGYEFSAGGYEPREIMECRKGTGCNIPAPKTKLVVSA